MYVVKISNYATYVVFKENLISFIRFIEFLTLKRKQKGRATVYLDHEYYILRLYRMEHSFNL